MLHKWGRPSGTRVQTYQREGQTAAGMPALREHPCRLTRSTPRCHAPGDVLCDYWIGRVLAPTVNGSAGMTGGLALFCQIVPIVFVANALEPVVPAVCGVPDE
jgi:hypothetical protein